MERKQITELDGIRGIAILLVIGFHFGNALSAGGPLHLLFGLGWSGVDLFFVLSGFLITGILLDTKGANNQLTSFYMRRALRILPLYYVSVAIFFWFAMPLMQKAGYCNGCQSSEQAWYWLHVSNWRTAFAPGTYLPLTHFWSLAIEEQFYLVWPIFVILLSERRLLLTSGLLIVASVALRNSSFAMAQQSVHEEFIYRLTPFRVEPLLIGAVACMLYRDPGLRAVSLVPARWVAAIGGFMVVVLAVVTHHVASTAVVMERVGYSALGISFGAFVLMAAIEADSTHLPATILRAPILRSFGKYSYGIYVFHGMLAILVPSAIAGLGWLPGQMAAICSVVIGAVVSYGMARVSWIVLERPFLKMKRYFPASRAVQVPTKEEDRQLVDR